MAFGEPHVGKSGKHYFNPKVMAHKGDMPEEGHPHIHHVEIHPHGPTSDHPHHVEVHHHDGTMMHGGEHENYDEASAAAKSHVDGMATDEPESDTDREEEGEPTSAMRSSTVRRSDSGAY